MFHRPLFAPEFWSLLLLVDDNPVLEPEPAEPVPVEPD